MRIALDDLELSKIYVIYPGDASYPLTADIQAVAVKDMKKYFFESD
jgi:hypothetical protein